MSSNLIQKNVITSQNYSKSDFVEYLKKNHLCYVSSTKVGSSVIRVIFLKHALGPIYGGKKYWFGNLNKFQKFFLQVKYKRACTPDERKVLFLVRNSFERVVSSFEFRKNATFNIIKADYLKKNIDIDSLTIVEYVLLMSKQYAMGNRDWLVAHFMIQKEAYKRLSPHLKKIDILWEMDYISDILNILSISKGKNIDINIKINVNIHDDDVYVRYYKENPELFDLVKNTFKEDLDWLLPHFKFEEDFKKRLNAQAPQK